MHKLLIFFITRIAWLCCFRCFSRPASLFTLPSRLFRGIFSVLSNFLPRRFFFGAREYLRARTNKWGKNARILCFVEVRKDEKLTWYISFNLKPKNLHYVSSYNLITYSSQTDTPNISFSALISFHIAHFFFKVLVWVKYFLLNRVTNKWL